MTKSENLKLWDSVCDTDPAVLKKVTVGRSFHAICAHSQIKKATELWGPMGKEWGVHGERFEIFDNNYCLYNGNLFYPDGNLPIHADIEVTFSSGTRKGKFNDDFTKKIATDALTKGLSKLGFNADVFEGKFDDNKYVEPEKSKPIQKKPPVKKPLVKQSDPDRKVIVAEIVSILTDKVFTDEDRQKAKEAIKKTKTNIALHALRATYSSEQDRRIKDSEPVEKELDIY